MADICGKLWDYNLARVVVIDVSDDYLSMRPPMPTECYRVLKEVWLPTYQILNKNLKDTLVDGYLYDWHESPVEEFGTWYVGVVHSGLLAQEALG